MPVVHLHLPDQQSQEADDRNHGQERGDTSEHIEHEGKACARHCSDCASAPAPDFRSATPQPGYHPRRMKAILIREHGGLDKLTMAEVPDPVPQPGQAVVRVRAVALNHLDLWLRRGVQGHTFPLPMIPGSEVTGVIEQVDDPNWRAGDEVIVAPGYSCGHCIACLSGNDPLCRNYGLFGETISGGAAEKIAVPIRNLIRKPAALSFAEAAAFPLDMLTAWHMLIARAQLRIGETVLVHAGGSGVGSAAIQIAKLFGATVYATAGTAAKASRAQALGADATIVYTETDFLDEVRRLTGKRGVDIVFEHVGGETFERSLRALTRGGRLVTCGATTRGEATINLRLVFFKLLSILGSTMGSLAELHQIVKLVEQGRLHPVIDRVLPLAEVAEGHRVLEAREAFGKIVFSV
jgi:NADPH:quinone reductase-like Zn-dependent oxidoreductase